MSVIMGTKVSEEKGEETNTKRKNKRSKEDISIANSCDRKKSSNNSNQLLIMNNLAIFIQVCNTYQLLIIYITTSVCVNVSYKILTINI